MDGLGIHRHSVRATATRWVADEPFPGIVEVQFNEHDGHVVTIHEKCSVIDEQLSQATHYPVEVLLPSESLAASTPAEFVRLLHGIQDLTGRTDFTVSWTLIDTAPPGHSSRN